MLGIGIVVKEQIIVHLASCRKTSLRSLLGKALKKRDEELRLISGLFSSIQSTPETACHCEFPAQGHNTNDIDRDFDSSLGFASTRPE